MLEAIALLIRAELKQEYIYSNRTGVFASLIPGLKVEALPKDFAHAIQETVRQMDQLDQTERASYYDSLEPPRDAIVKNWLILEAICRRDLGISLEWESMKAMGRLHEIMWDDDLLNLVPGYEKLEEKLVEANQQEEEDTNLINRLRNEKFEILAAHVFSLGYQGTASPEIRSAIMDWYRKTALVLIENQLENKNLPLPEFPASEALSELEKLVHIEHDQRKSLHGAEQAYPTRTRTEAQEDQIHSLTRELKIITYKKNRCLIQAVGLDLDEYHAKIGNQMNSLVIQKLNIRISEEEPANSAAITTQDRNRVKAEILSEWKKNGIPDQPFPGLKEMVRP